ncbi:MAG: type VII secretion protein EccB [Propionibacteriaceae bacterium]|nr:type VII secretion protein EccB [Propionibacteriaceae bacterium]
MPSPKEILEAQKYNRQRLVTAFAAGVPDGKEVTPRSAFAPMVVGAILVALMMLVAALLGWLSPKLPQNWQNSTLIVVKGSGARYYSIDATLHPVTNITSAKLLAERGSYQTSEVSASTIDGIARGVPIGLTGVPDDVPAAKDLRSELWFSCPLEEGTHTWVAALPSNRVRRGSAVVRSQEQLHLVTDGVRHPISEEHRRTVLLALGLETTAPVTVPASWLALFRPGSELAPLTISDAGQPVTDMPPALEQAVVGSVVEVGDGGRRYVITGAGRAAPLTEVASRLYPSSAPIPASVQDMAGLEVESAGAAPADWPGQLGELVPADAMPCARLSRDAAGEPVTLLESMERNALAAALPGGQEQGLHSTGAASSVLGGSGALLRASDGGELGQVMLVSDLGLVHGLGSASEESLARLGYGQAQIVELPAAWPQLIPPGTTLDPAGAWATVGER